MLVEIHMLQNHAPSNLNRDDTGSPKDAVFGGVRRSRISSQALKRAIRRSSVFQEALHDAGLGLRTRQLPEQVKRILLERGMSEEMAEIGASKASGFGTREGKEQTVDEYGDLETAQIMYLTPLDIEAVADVVFSAGEEAGTPADFRKVSAKQLQAQAKDNWRPITPDVALFGRMITSDAFRDVESSVQVAHALSTHRMEHEFDYFTAVDDLLDPLASAGEKGAAMIGDVEFTSACYYKYFSIDLDGMVDNLVREGASKGDNRRADAMALARTAVLAFLEAAVFSSPSGKQNTFAAHQLPDAILVEVRERKVPVSYANAFVKPVAPRGMEDLVDLSIKAFQQHVELLTKKFGLTSAERLWFSTRDVEISGTQVCLTLPDLLAKLKDAFRSDDTDG